MRRIAGHDERALEALYDRYATAVMGMAMRILENREQAEEVVQETFWRAWSKADTYRVEKGAPLSWLFGIAHHLSIDITRSLAARPQLTALKEVELNSSREDAVDEIAWLAIMRRQLQAALAALPSEQREVLMLAYYGGLTHREIAETTSVPLGTVHTRARLGLKKLRAELRKQDFELD